MAEINNGIFFNNIDENALNKEIIQAIENFARVNPNQIISNALKTTSNSL